MDKNQSFDTNNTNFWNDTAGRGNYWSDWTVPDENEDGIVDMPCNISGSGYAKDFFPLVHPTYYKPVPRGFITGTIISNCNGNPVAGALVMAIGRDDAAFTDYSGRYNLSLPVGTYVLTISAAGYNSHHQRNVAVTKDNGTIVDCTLIGYCGKLRGRVIDTDTGLGVAGAIVTAEGWLLPSFADDSGAYAFETINTGTYSVSISADGYLPSSEAVVVFRGRCSCRDFRLSPEASLTGTVIDNRTGKAILGAQIKIGKLSISGDSCGGYNISGMPAGICHVLAGADGYGGIELCIALMRGENHLNIRLNAAGQGSESAGGVSLAGVGAAVLNTAITAMVCFRVMERRRAASGGDAGQAKRTWRLYKGKAKKPMPPIQARGYGLHVSRHA